MSGMPHASSGPWKKWRSTSGAHNGPVRQTRPLNYLKETGEKHLSTLVAEGLQVQFEGCNTPAKDTLLTLLGMWIIIDVKGEAGSPSELLHNLAPGMGEEFIQQWEDKYSHMSVGRAA